MSAGNVITAVAKSRAHSIAALAHCGIRQANGVEMILHQLDTGDVHLDFNDAGVDAEHRGAHGFVKHSVISSRNVTTASYGALSAHSETRTYSLHVRTVGDSDHSG